MYFSKNKVLFLPSKITLLGKRQHKIPYKVNLKFFFISYLYIEHLRDIKWKVWSFSPHLGLGEMKTRGNIFSAWMDHLWVIYLGWSRGNILYKTLKVTNNQNLRLEISVYRNSYVKNISNRHKNILVLKSFDNSHQLSNE